jgi:hypothetical protein
MKTFLALVLVFLPFGSLRAAAPASNEVLFEFYSSDADEVSLAYLHRLQDSWRYVKMRRDGNRYYVSHPVEDEIWYEFTTSPNVWYRRDPFNRQVDSDHPYLKRKAGQPLVQRQRSPHVTYVASEHFDYFTTGDGTKIKELEAVYRTLTERLLTVLEPGLAPIHGKKIRFYGGIFEGAYTTADNAEIIEGGDYPNSHEIIHALLHQYPRLGPFAEGMAQCFQKSGNFRPLGEANCSLAAREKYKTTKLWDVLGDFGNHADYHMAGSFIFHQLYVAPGRRAGFVAFLKEFQPGVSPSFEGMQGLYQKHTGRELRMAVDEWEKWVALVTPTSRVYVDWNNTR